MDRLSLTMELTNRTEMQQKLIITPRLRNPKNVEPEKLVEKIFASLAKIKKI